MAQSRAEINHAVEMIPAVLRMISLFYFAFPQECGAARIRAFFRSARVRSSGRCRHQPVTG
jgi:hypothetical protein